MGYINYLLVWGSFDYEDDICQLDRIYGFEDHPTMKDAEEKGEYLIENGKCDSYVIIDNDTKIIL
jgi:hypothetical protein